MCLTIACANGNKTVVETDSPEAQAMLDKLKAIPLQRQFMFGHHDDPVYGIGWDGDSARSDVKSVCGDNPVTGKDSWDVSDSTVVKSVLPGGVNHDKFMGWLDKVADYLNSIQTSEGIKVPVLFRPWHEHTGSWFWWGQNLCSTEDYKALWRMTYERMQEKGATQLLYAYSPGTEPKDSVEYLERYPGDDIIDLIGVDAYQFDKEAYVKSLDNALTIMTQVGKAHQKPIAVTETGYETIPDSVWWTQTLMPVIEKYPISYVLVWRNARSVGR